MIHKISGLFILACLFPFVTPIRLGFDSQPYALMLAVCLLALVSLRRQLSISKYFVGFALAILYAIATFFFNIVEYNSPDYFTGVRSLFSLISLPIGILAFMNVGTPPARLIKFIKVAIYIYTAVGLIQLVYKNFLSFLLARASTSEGRGVYSLTVEPVEYARMSIFFFVLVCLFRLYNYCDLKRFKKLTYLLLLQVILSLAGTGFVWIAAIGFFFLFFNSGISKIRLTAIFFAFILCLVGICYIGVTYFPDKRIFYLINIALERPEELSKSGGFILRSLNPIHSVIVGLGMYNGMGVGLAFPGRGQINYDFLGPMFNNVGVAVSGRSHGGMFSLIYEIGIFGIIYIASIFGFLLKDYRRQNAGLSMRFIIFTFLLVTLFDGPLANPMLIIVVSLFYYLQRYQKTVMSLPSSSS